MYVEKPPVEESRRFIEESKDGLGLSKIRESASMEVIQEVVEKATFRKCFHYITNKLDHRRLVVKCCQASCKWS